MGINELLVLIFIVAPLSTIIHESGHLYASSWMKSDHIKISIGYGKERWSFSLNDIQIVFHTFFFVSGRTSSVRNRPYKSWELMIISLCGPLNNIIFAFLFYFSYNIYPSDLFLYFILFNGWLFISNIIPYTIKGKHSDGYMLLKILLNHIKNKR